MPLTITEYESIGATQRGPVPVPCEPATAIQTAPIELINTVSDALDPSTCLVRLIPSDNWRIDISADNPDATNSNRVLAAGTEQIIAVAAGSKMKIGVTASPDSKGSSMNGLG